MYTHSYPQLTRLGFRGDDDVASYYQTSWYVGVSESRSFILRRIRRSVIVPLTPRTVKGRHHNITSFDGWPGMVEKGSPISTTPYTSGGETRARGHAGG